MFYFGNTGRQRGCGGAGECCRGGQLPKETHPLQGKPPAEENCPPKGRQPQEERKPCAGCREFHPCSEQGKNTVTISCPELLRWALWSSGFFRCNACEKSGWQKKRGGRF